MALTITDCKATPSSITVYFSEAVITSSTQTAEYTLKREPSRKTVTHGTPQYRPHERAAFIPLPGAGLKAGDWIKVVVNDVVPEAHSSTNATGLTFYAQVNGDGGGATQDVHRTTKAVEDAVSYPLLTEQVSFPSSGGGPITGVTSGGRGASLDSTAAVAVTNVLGWKINSSDPKGFIGAITQAFTLTEVEGHTEAAWNPRTYAVQTDLGGGMTGAQASLYTRANDAVQQSLQLLDGLYPLDPDADPEYVKALREMAKSQMNEILTQFGAVGGPSVLRVNTYFNILLGQNNGHTEFNPDRVRGTLGTLRRIYGIYFAGNPFSNSVEDEQDSTNFRVISDYMTSLLQSWISNKEFFELGSHRPAFFGTQLVLLSRQLSVIVETVNEVRFALDSVFIGPSERQSLLLEFTERDIPSMFVEDILQEIQDFTSDEAPRLLQDGGKVSVQNNILPVMGDFERLADLAHRPVNRVPDGYRTVRVQRSLDDLRDQLGAFTGLARQVVQSFPLPLQEPELGLRVTGITPNPATLVLGSAPVPITIIGTGFEAGMQVNFTPIGLTIHGRPTVLSVNLVVVEITWSGSAGPFTVEVANPDGRTHTLPNGFIVN